jgi:hypothetical protein
VINCKRPIEHARNRPQTTQNTPRASRREAPDRRHTLRPRPGQPGCPQRRPVGTTEPELLALRRGQVSAAGPRQSGASTSRSAAAPRRAAPLLVGWAVSRSGTGSWSASRRRAWRGARHLLTVAPFSTGSQADTPSALPRREGLRRGQSCVEERARFFAASPVRPANVTLFEISFITQQVNIIVTPFFSRYNSLTQVEFCVMAAAWFWAARSVPGLRVEAASRDGHAHVGTLPGHC